MKPIYEMVIVTALSCEARPLIDYFHLKKEQEVGAFPLYRNESLGLTLVVSGVGALYAAAATAFAASYFRLKPVGFINIGIAGAFDVAVGSLRLVNKVSDESGKSFYPMALSHFKMASTPLITVTQPTLACPGMLVDMEGFGFYQTAARFTTLELIHSLKVISDNQDQGFKQINANQVKHWISSHLDAIELFLTRLNELVAKRDSPDVREVHLFQRLSEQFHITQYQRYQVRKLLQKILAFELEAEEVLIRAECRSIKEWLEKVQNRIYTYSLGVFNEA